MGEEVEKKFEKDPALVMMGGGTGNSTLLGELKHQTDELTAIVNMCDDGSSTGHYRTKGASAMGDLRQCLSALSFNERWARIFEEREDGHPLGNLALVILEKRYGDINEAVEEASDMLELKAKVYPVTKDKPHLVMQDGEEVYRGETVIGARPFDVPRPRIWLEPESQLNPPAESALYEADLIAIAPGNLYRSILPTLAVRGMRETLHYASGRKVMIANLLNQKGQTDGWHVMDYVKEIEKYTGKNSIDDVIYNTALPNRFYLEEIGEPHSEPVGISKDEFDYMPLKAIASAVLSQAVLPPEKNDDLHEGSRSRLRHDAGRVTGEIMSLLRQS